MTERRVTSRQQLALLSILLGCACSTAHRYAYSASEAVDPTWDDVDHFDETAEQLYAKSEYRMDLFSTDRQQAMSLNLRQRALGACDVTVSLNSLAAIYWTQGAFAKAESLLMQMLRVCETTLGAEHLHAAICLNNLAVLYEVRGAYAKAEPLLRRAIEIIDKALGPMDAEVANGLNNLALLYYVTGDYVRAESLYIRALDIREKVLGAMHPDVANSLSSLALLYWKRGDYDEAEPLYLRAQRIHERASGSIHPDVVFDLDNLAGLYVTQRFYEKAEPLMVRALAVAEATVGATHPTMATLSSNLAVLHWARGTPEKAVLLESRAAEIREMQMALDLARLSESGMRAQMALLQGETDAVVSLHADALPSSTQALELALTTVLRRKGRILDALADDRLSVRTHLSPELRKQWDQLTAVSTALSNRIRAPFETRTAVSRESEISRLRARAEELESGLNAESTEFRVRSAPVTIASVRAALPPESSLVEFVRYHRFDARLARPWQEARYAAYILPWQGPARWVALGEAAPIDAGVDAVLATMRKGADPDATRRALQHLDRLVFEPVRSLVDVSHVILSPDGKLNLVPFEALVDPQGRYEVELRLMSYVTSGRDLLRLTARRAPRSAVTLVADPAYGPDHGPGSFHKLQGASREVAELQKLFPGARMLTGDAATKAALAKVVGAAILHIATHGLYARATVPAGISFHGPMTAAADALPAALPAPWDVRAMYVELANWSSPALSSSLGDPIDALDRAGLVLAGANQGSDGIVSARELAGYDWWGTQLVVLSACETGLGAVVAGDGVYGMRRALVLAGTESQVVSLWNVSDASTSALMQAFYGELARGTGRSEALRRAKFHLLRQPRFSHPYYWAAFIAAGDWAPLAPGILSHRGAGQ